MLYNLGIGATEKELQWTYEGSDEFAPLPTFGVIPQFPASAGLPLDWLPNYNPASISDLILPCYTHGRMACKRHMLALTLIYVFRRNWYTGNNT